MINFRTSGALGDIRYTVIDKTVFLNYDFYTVVASATPTSGINYIRVSIDTADVGAIVGNYDSGAAAITTATDLSIGDGAYAKTSSIQDIYFSVAVLMPAGTDSSEYHFTGNINFEIA